MTALDRTICRTQFELLHISCGGRAWQEFARKRKRKVVEEVVSGGQVPARPIRVRGEKTGKPSDR